MQPKSFTWTVQPRFRLRPHDTAFEVRKPLTFAEPFLLEAAAPTTTLRAGDFASTFVDSELSDFSPALEVRATPTTKPLLINKPLLSQKKFSFSFAEFSREPLPREYPAVAARQQHLSSLIKPSSAHQAPAKRQAYRSSLDLS